MQKIWQTLCTMADCLRPTAGDVHMHTRVSQGVCACTTAAFGWAGHGCGKRVCGVYVVGRYFFFVLSACVPKKIAGLDALPNADGLQDTLKKNVFGMCTMNPTELCVGGKEDGATSIRYNVPTLCQRSTEQSLDTNVV